MAAADLPAEFIVRHSASSDLKAILGVSHWIDLAAEFYIRPDTLRGDSLTIPNNNRLLTVGGNDRTMMIPNRRKRVKIEG